MRISFFLEQWSRAPADLDILCTFMIFDSISGEFLAPNFNTAEMIGDLYSQSVQEDEHVRQCFYEGNIVGDLTSKVTINICQGLVSVRSIYKKQIKNIELHIVIDIKKITMLTMI